MSDTTKTETPAATETENQLALAKSAIHHVLNALCDDPAKYWLMGNGTGSWEKLTTAAAAIYGRTKEEIAARFTPEKHRFDAYCQQHEADLELLRYCQDNGIKVPKE